MAGPHHNHLQVAQGAYIYEYADWGGLIIMARYPGDGSGAPDAADELRFSLDYGQCWRVGWRAGGGGGAVG